MIDKPVDAKMTVNKSVVSDMNHPQLNGWNRMRELIAISTVLTLLTVVFCQSESQNLMSDGDFEAQVTDTLQTPWHYFPQHPEQFRVTSGESAYSGEKYISVSTSLGTWFEISQFLQLQPGKQYLGSFYVKGDNCELHAGAWAPDNSKFLGWNNDVIPENEWREVVFSFAADVEHPRTKIYIAIRNDFREVEVSIDRVKVEAKTE